MSRIANPLYSGSSPLPASIFRVSSSMVERTTHNGNVAGSNPA